VRAPLPHVVTIHDVTFFHIATFGRATTLAMRTIVSGVARHADELIAVSAAARDEICATLGVDPARIAVVPNGAGRPPEVEPLPADEVRSRQRLAPGARVVLNVAAVRPHKNQELLVRALRHLPPEYVVVLAGALEPYAEDVRALAAELGVTDRLRLPGYLPDAELEGLWRLAGCAAFPTRAEGFGLPVLEAMHRGVPVACSDIPVLREVGGEIPRYFDPDDPAGAASAIEAAAATVGGPAAQAQAGRFTWERAAQGTLEAYERALSGPSAAAGTPRVR
jgi:glycosyltransferase involved in cell wall biosynthesis